jgi:hypothetical protein
VTSPIFTGEEESHGILHVVLDARFAKELEEQTGKMSELSRAKFQLEYEKSRRCSKHLGIGKGVG